MGNSKLNSVEHYHHPQHEQVYSNFDDLRELLPSRCTLGLAFCQGTCHAIGRRDGKCQYGEGCECSEERISPAEFALCAAESTCRADCQRRGKASGRCDGWSCQCLSEDPNELYEN